MGHTETHVVPSETPESICLPLVAVLILNLFSLLFVVSSTVYTKAHSISEKDSVFLHYDFRHLASLRTHWLLGQVFFFFCA